MTDIISNSARHYADSDDHRTDRNAPAAHISSAVAHDARTTLKTLLEGATTIRGARECLEAAEAAATAHPRDRDVQSLLLQIREKAGDHRGLAEAWAALFERFPEDEGILRFHLRWLMRERKEQLALEVIQTRLPEDIADFPRSLSRAELLDDVQAFGEADRLFRLMLERFGDRRELRVSYAKRLKKRGLLADALDVISPVAPALPQGSRSHELAVELAETVGFLARHEAIEDLRGQDVRIIAMKHAVLSFRERSVQSPRGGKTGAIALVTGSLGPGGAERQLTRLACLLQEQGDSPVQVLVKSLSSDRHNDFFLPDLEDRGIPAEELDSAPAIASRKQGIDDPDLARLLEMLPSQVHYGVTRLAPKLRDGNFGVVSLWQDGACLFGALAALLAGAPRIQLVFRGLPPNIRLHRFRPEYGALFQAMAEIPGVQFVSNSRTAADAYAAWLGLPAERFAILYNGVPPLDVQVDPDEELVWREFEERTAGATETIGGVFRFEPDKRPLLWIKLAHRYLKRNPGARFVIVGHGRLFPNALALADELGIGSRILFVGHSAHVGSWYSRMDVKVLLSRFEGLPNVLIEAQSVGVPVVSTPAGGAHECFLEGATGHILSSVETPCLDEACDKIASLARGRHERGHATERARRFVTEHFSVELVLNRFLSLSGTDSMSALAEAAE